MLKENEIKVGDTHSAVLVEDLKRTQIVRYAGASGDYNHFIQMKYSQLKLQDIPVFLHMVCYQWDSLALCLLITSEMEL